MEVEIGALSSEIRSRLAVDCTYGEYQEKEKIRETHGYGPS